MVVLQVVRVVVGWAHILKKGKEDTLNVPLCVDQVRGWCAVVALGMGHVTTSSVPSSVPSGGLSLVDD